MKNPSFRLILSIYKCNTIRIDNKKQGECNVITHILDIKLQTVSIEGVKQVYRDILSFPIKKKQHPSFNLK